MNRFDLTFNTIFKIGLLLLGVVFLFELHSFNQKGRYQNTETLGSILDTTTGIVYLPQFHNSGKPGLVVRSKSNPE